MRAVDEDLGETVQAAVAVGVQQRLRGRRHGGVRSGGQRPLVVEPPHEERLYGRGVRGEQPGHRVEVARPRLVRGPVGEDQAAQQVQADGLRHAQRRPEPGPEDLGRQPALPPPFRDGVGQEPQYLRVRRRVGQAGEHLGEQPGGPPGVRVEVEGVHQLLEGQGELGDAVLTGEEQERLDD